MLSVEMQTRSCKKCRLKTNCATWKDRKEAKEVSVSGWDINKMAESCKEYDDVNKKEEFWLARGC